MDVPEVPIPEVPTIAEATIIPHPKSGHDCLVVTTEEGERVAFGFEVESDNPGLEIVDPYLWGTAADRGAPEHDTLRFQAVVEPQADDWLQAVISHPVGNEWLSRIKHAHPAEYHEWFAQTQYDEGGEEGSG